MSKKLTRWLVIFTLLTAASISATAAGWTYSRSGGGPSVPPEAWCADQIGMAINVRWNKQRPTHHEYLDVGGPLWGRSLGPAGVHHQIGDLYDDYNGKVKILALLNQESFHLSMPSLTAPLSEWTTFGQAFGDQAVAMADAYGSKIAAFEIWNEPDCMPPNCTFLSHDRLGEVINWTAYKLAYAGHHQKIVTGGLVGGDWPNYLANLSGYVWSSYIDGFGFHPYTKSVNGIPVDNTGTLSDAIDQAYAAAGNRPIWLTEFGLPEPNGSPDWQRQANYLAGAYDLFKSKGPSIVPHAFWFAYDDDTHYKPEVESMGLVDDFHNRRLSGDAFLAKVRDAEEALSCRTWDGDVDACNAHGYGTTQDCAYYTCKGTWRARGTSN